MKKLLLIPRAIMDVLSISLSDIPLAEKSSLTYALLILKLKKWLFKENSIITFPLLGFKIKCCNNQFVQHLVKEIFLDKVYNLNHVFKDRQALSIIDAGANIGLSTFFFKKKFKCATIFSFEPSLSSFDLLQKNVERSGLGGITVQRVAVGNKDGILYAEKGFGPCSQNQTFTDHGAKEDAVESVRLTGMLQNSNWDCVKLDIEGAEVHVLIDVIHHKLLKRAVCWLIEFHQNDSTREWIFEEFRKEGFVFTHKNGVYCFVQGQQRLSDN